MTAATHLEEPDTKNHCNFFLMNTCSATLKRDHTDAPVQLLFIDLDTSLSEATSDAEISKHGACNDFCYTVLC